MSDTAVTVTVPTNITRCAGMSATEHNSSVSNLLTKQNNIRD